MVATSGRPVVIHSSTRSLPIPRPKFGSQVTSAKAQLAGVQIPVTVYELAYGYQERGGAQDVLDAIGYINIHILPFFSSLATTGALAWPQVETDVNWFVQQGGGKVYFDENGLRHIFRCSVQQPGCSRQCQQRAAILPVRTLLVGALDDLHTPTPIIKSLDMGSTTPMGRRNLTSSPARRASQASTFGGVIVSVVGMSPEKIPCLYCLGPWAYGPYSI